MINSDSNQSLPIVEINNFESPKHVRNDLYKYLQADSTCSSPSKKGEDLKFIPYFQERDHLGNLLSKNVSRTRAGSMSKTPSHTKYRGFDMSYSRNPSPTHSQAESQEFKFETFKYLPRIPTHPKDSLRKILKPSSVQNSTSSSPCFKSQGRTSSLYSKVGPSVGHYEIADSLLHKSASEISFPKQIRMAPIVKEASPTTSEEVDIVKSFKKIYNRPFLIPDFGRQTNRNTHFISKTQFGSGQKVKKHHASYVDDKSGMKIKDASKKEAANDMAKYKRTNSLNPKSLPMTTLGLNDKFGQVKRKYNIVFNMKLK